MLLGFELKNIEGRSYLAAYDSISKEWQPLLPVNRRSRRYLEKVILRLNGFIQNLETGSRIDYSRRHVRAEDDLQIQKVLLEKRTAELEVKHAQELAKIATERAAVEWDARQKLIEQQTDLNRKESELSASQAEVRRMQGELDRLSGLVGKLTREK